MDLARIKAYGTSTTSKAWLTNPLRSMLWRLSAPYFQGFAAELTAITSALADAVYRLAGLEKAAVSGEQARAELGERVAATAKDAMAVAYRLAGLEKAAASGEQARVELGEKVTAALEKAAASGEQARVELGEKVTAALEKAAASGEQARVELGERVIAAAKEAHEAVAYVAALHQEVRSSVQVLNEHIDSRTAAVAKEAHEAAAYIAALHQEVRSSVQGLNDRIDSLARGAPLRAGDRVSVGQDNLLLVATAFATRFLVRQHDLIGHLVADGHEWETHVRAAIERAAQPDGVAVDAGAYIGLHTVTMSRWFRTVHAFEPQRGIYHLLCGNVALNGCTNVAAYNTALYDRSGSMRQAPPERQEVQTPMRDGQPDYARITNAAALTFEVVDDGSGEIRAIALDDLGLERVALIKVDTQGADLRVLRGAEGTIRRCRPTVIFEWERDLGIQHGAALEDYHAFFTALDYDVDLLKEISPGRQADYLARPR